MAEEITTPDDSGQLEKQASSVSIPCWRKHQKLMMCACCCVGVVFVVILVMILFLIWKFSSPGPQPYAYPPPPPPPPQQVPAIYGGASDTGEGSFGED